GDLLAPGFVDLQVNGGGGVLFNDEPTIDAVSHIAAAHRPFGTTGMLPTFITDTADKMALAIEAVDQAITADIPGVLGIHLEGPFLNPQRKGAHAASLMRSFTPADQTVITSLNAGATLVTLAPESVPPGTVSGLVNAGIIVAAGHTAATFDQINEALAEGLTGFTHLFNAMTPLNSRAPGVVGAALDHPHSWFGFIGDCIHVHPASLRIALAAKQRGGAILVTDAMSPVGAQGQTEFILSGEAVTLRDGRLTTRNGTLAGSVLDMAAGLRNLVELLNQPLEEALRMTSTYPARAIGLGDRLGRIAPGYDADLVLLGEGNQVRATWIGGQLEEHDSEKY
ncbi:MAG: N-acetylglucosamine-6-phosphate deacetylase, partial [Alphaproteobacteria bacterium]